MRQLLSDSIEIIEKIVLNFFSNNKKFFKRERILFAS